MTKTGTLNKGMLGVYVVGSQVFVSTVIAALLLLTAGKEAALAALSGGWTAVLANLYFALQAFRHSGAQASRDIVRAFYQGEAGKFVIVILLLLATFKLLPGARENAAIIFTAFFVVYGVAWVVPAVFRRV